MRPLLVLFLIPLLVRSGLAQVDSVVVFNEIHYHPAGDDASMEYVELYNQNSVNVDLSGWKLQGAGEYLFETGTTILGRSYLVIAKDPASLGGNALGPLTGRLANGGERLTLRNHNDRIMDQVEFGDDKSWPIGPDGSGATLSKRDPFQSSPRPDHWRASRALGGTPGTANDTETASSARLAFSEVAITRAENVATIEVFNAGDQVENLAEVELRTQAGTVVLLPETSLVSGAYLTFTVDSVAVGERLFLIHPATQQLIDSVVIEATPKARDDFPDGSFYTPRAPTPNAVNAFAFEDRIVINELMYHHRAHYADPEDPESVYAEVDEEWIELFNRSAESVDLSGWHFSDGIRYEFPEGTLLGPGAYLVVANNVAALKVKYPGIDIIGDVDGSMANSDERVALSDAHGNPVDSVHYFDDAPWPRDADAGGSSLELRHPDLDNRQPEAWAASDESLKSEWHTYTYRATAIRPVYTATVRNFHELRLGFLQAGSCLIDNVSVVEDPEEAKVELVRNRTFGSLFAPISSGNWQLLGNHSKSEAISDPEAGSVLKVVAESSMNYLNNLCEATLTDEVETGKTYEVSFDAKWLSGSPTIRTEVYYNKFAKKHVLIMPEKHGTPGARNSTFTDNPGPTYHGLTHSPAVPSSDQAIEVSVASQAHSGIDSLTLFYAVNEGDWQAEPMNLAADGRYQATVPAQSNGAVVQFYVEGKDVRGGVSWYPAAGPQSGAFVRVDSSVNPDRRQSMRLITRASDAAAIHRGPDILDNSRRNCTVIMNEQDITYNCGIRLRGSMFSRSGGAGHNIKFPATQRFRGTQPTVIIRQRNPQEILVKHMANQAGGVPASYNDLIELRGYRGGQNGITRMEMARFGENYLSGAFENGETQSMFKMEGIRDFQQTGANGAKLPMPIGWIVQFDFADLGDDKEQYRHVIRMISARKQDDYSAIIAMCKAFSAPDDELRDAVDAVIDVNEWCRMMAMQTLCGIADVYPVENPHNFNIYPRPTDGKIIAIPWDWDFTFNLAPTSNIIDPRSSRKNLWRILSAPGINRLYRGHLLDLIDTVFNETYANTWFSHYGDVAGASYSSNVGYVRSRATSVKSQASSQTNFKITANEGKDMSVNTAEVSLQGTGNVRILTLEHVETGEWYQPEWLDDETWMLTVPLLDEVNEITLQARDYQGGKGSLFAPMGNDSITVTNTSGVVAPTGDNLLVTEIMYHPIKPSDTERVAGFDDQDQFEYIELMNIGDRPIDLSRLLFSEGVRFDFTTASTTTLQPGGIGLLVANEAAFISRYGPSQSILGVYEGQLANGGETLALTSINGRTVQRLTYDDKAPWPLMADGEGFSLTLTAVDGSADLGDGASWQASIAGGTPGAIEDQPNVDLLSYAAWLTEVFNEAEQADANISDANADPDGDQRSNLIEYAFVLDPKVPNHTPDLTISRRGSTIQIAFQQRRGVSAVIEVSTDLLTWSSLANERVESVIMPMGEIEARTVTFPSQKAGYVRLKVHVN